MSNDYLWFVPIFPLLAAIVTAIIGPKLNARAAYPTLIGIGLSVYCALASLMSTPGGGVQFTDAWEWLRAGTFSIPFQLQCDPLTAIMLVTVTSVSFLVAVFSVDYMKGDAGYSRYFAVFSLFVFSMTMLILSSNFLLTFLFWEGVGLCSYLLIGHWFHKPSAAKAARKAFIVNRIGDVGFLIAIALMWVHFGTLDYSAVLDEKQIKAFLASSNGFAAISWICFFLILAAIGKSAQFPLHVWLPDAMEGPTPVSALIHAATMVTAGVYLIARASPLFVFAPEMQLLIAVLGCITAIMAAIIAITQTDLKRVLAYSTCSQLGFMFLALGSAAGNNKIIAFAVTAAIFHLFTHAFFKALLFLGSGSVMHSMGDVIDMRQFSGLRHKLPWTHVTFAVGAASLAGMVPFAGFWSKDEILACLSYASGVSIPAYAEAAAGIKYPITFTIILLVTLITSAVTAFYTFRAFFKTFWGPEKFPEHLHGHVHEGGYFTKLPLVILAVAATLLPWIFGPMTERFTHYLTSTPGLAKGETLHPGGFIVGFSMVVPFLCAGLAYMMYARVSPLPEKLASRRRGLFNLSQGKFYIDELYSALFVKPIESIARGLRWFDVNILDGLVELFAKASGNVGKLIMPVQNGLVQFYALAMLLGIVVFIVAMVARLHAG